MRARILGPTSLRLKPHFIFRNGTEVAAWCAANGKEGALREAIAQGAVSGQSARIAEAWLSQVGAEEATELQLRSLDAEQRSAAAAERSARWAGWAIVISLVALALSVTGYIRQ